MAEKKTQPLIRAGASNSQVTHDIPPPSYESLQIGEDSPSKVQKDAKCEEVNQQYDLDFLINKDSADVVTKSEATGVSLQGKTEGILEQDLDILLSKEGTEVVSEQSDSASKTNQEIKVVKGELVLPSEPVPANSPSPVASETRHRLKKVKFFNREVSICLQNENGPCPLLALANVLILRGSIEIHPDRSEINSSHLIQLIAGHLLESNPPLTEDNELSRNQQKTLADIIDVLPTLQVGLDVNVHFVAVDKFEYDSRIAVFDMLDISLYHGWIVDANDEISYSVLFDKSYNQLVDKIIAGQQAEEDGSGSSTEVEQTLREAMVGRQFLDNAASQLTYAGLMELHTKVRERETCVFFRNNHFSTMYKLEGQLYLLLTDQGYEKQNCLAWERLNDIDGNTELVSPTFGNPNEYIEMETLPSQAVKGPTKSGNVDQDHMLAMQLMQQELEEQERNSAGTTVAEVQASQQREFEAIQRRQNKETRNRASANQRSKPQDSSNNCSVS
mmetsp:Transcript_9566/g.11006  ORF Transcript_9566/g.11006 Transcript_9566/m.11006 type:complete len:502 (-) Transcript_9566:277-1782(-)